MTWGAVKNQLGPDPAEALAHISGEWSLRCLLLTLILSSISRWRPRWRAIALRRMVGLYSFFYAVLHLLVYLIFLLGWHWSDLLSDVIERPYITVGVGAFFLMLPLAMTSNRFSIVRLGRNWKKLHQLVYLAVLLVLIHIWWQVRSDAGEAVFYTALCALLMVERLIKRRTITA